MADKWIQLQSSDGVDNLFPTSKMDLLWTNAASATFPAQTLAVPNLTNYSKIMILCESWFNGNQYHSNWLLNDNLKHMICSFEVNDTSYSYTQMREITITGNNIAFSQSYVIQGGGSAQIINNDTCCPIKIYGIK